MKKIATILLLFTYLFATTELCQLFKLPALMSHFIEHKNENKNLTLWQFLCIHYAHGNVKDADYDKDMKLPFKTSENFAFSICIPAPPQASINFSFKEFYASRIKKQFFTQDFLFSSYYLSNIWQPPRVA